MDILSVLTVARPTLPFLPFAPALLFAALVVVYLLLFDGDENRQKK